MCYSVAFFPYGGGTLAERESQMVQETAPARRQLGALGKMARRKRIFARLREGASYEEIAGEEAVSRERIRQIVSEVLQKRSVDSGADHAKLQLDRLAPAVQLGAEAIAAGEISAITPFLKASTGSTATSRSPGPIRSMTTRRARSLWKGSTAWPRTLGSTRSCGRRGAST